MLRVKGQPEVIWGHRAQILISTKNAYLYVTWFINVTHAYAPLQNLLTQIKIWGHRGQKFRY